MKFHLTSDQFGCTQWLMLLKHDYDYCDIAKSVANVIYKQTFDDPHWAADFAKGRPYSYITHPFKTLPAHYSTFATLLNRSSTGVYINKSGGMQPAGGMLKVLEEADCAYWPSDEISGSISKWHGGSHWYISADGISIEKKTGYKEKFDSHEQARTFLERFMPASKIKTNENFRDFKIGD